MREKLQELLRNRKRLTLTIIFGPAFLFIFNIAALVYTIKVPEKSLPGTYESKLFGVMDLVTVILGTALSFLYGLILFVIQIFKITKFEGMTFISHNFPLLETAPLMVLPFCCISMAARLIIRKIYEWNINEENDKEHFAGEGLIGGLNNMLRSSLSWPVAAIAAMIPLLGIIRILSLFGQYPDNVIRAWTETAQWNLSKMEAPPIWTGLFLLAYLYC